VKIPIGLLAIVLALLLPLDPIPPVAAQAAWPAIGLTSPIGGFVRPVHVTHAGDGSGRLFVVQQNGRIYIVKNGVRVSAPFLDISARVSEAMLSVAFPPGFGKKGKKSFYVNYVDLQWNVVIGRYHVSSNPDVADSANEEIVLKVSSPWPPTRNTAGHAGGELAFGPDGLLYVGIGDGGVGNRDLEGDLFNLAQDPGSLRGKIVRLDVETKKPYRVPSSNPFVRTPGWRGEIWALGLRNPFRSAFDRVTGEYYIADVGQNRFEEINVQPAGSRGGQNYGWKIMEGYACYVPADCDATGLTLPVHAYEHDPDHVIQCSVTGGRVYRGTGQPGMQGIYFFGDLCSGRIFGLRRTDAGWESALVYDPQTEPTPTISAYGLVTFGEDQAGNLYVSDYNAGLVYSIVQE
jgi:glucose/arabinose dehydrogenase